MKPLLMMWCSKTWKKVIIRNIISSLWHQWWSALFCRGTQCTASREAISLIINIVWCAHVHHPQLYYPLIGVRHTSSCRDVWSCEHDAAMVCCGGALILYNYSYYPHIRTATPRQGTMMSSAPLPFVEGIFLSFFLLISIHITSTVALYIEAARNNKPGAHQ